jgi:hypothetical protein
MCRDSGFKGWALKLLALGLEACFCKPLDSGLRAEEQRGRGGGSSGEAWG